MSNWLANTELIKKIDSTPIEDLNLSTRSYNSLKRSNVDLLSQIIDLGEKEILKLRNVSKLQMDEIFDAIASFLAVSRASLVELKIITQAYKTPKTVDIDPTSNEKILLELENGFQVQEVFPLQDNQLLVIGIDRDKLAELVNKIYYTNIKELNLSAYSYNALKRLHISSLNQIIDLYEADSSTLRKLSKQQQDEIFDSTAKYLGLSRFSLMKLNIITQAYKIPETPYINTTPKEKYSSTVENFSPIEKRPPPKDTRPFVIDISPDILPNLVELIVLFCEKLLKISKLERWFEILKRRFGLEGNKIYTLQEIADFYDLTRERVRQIEERSIVKIKNALLGIFPLLHQRIPQNLINEAKEFLNLLQSKDAILTEQEIIQIVEERYLFKLPPKKINNLRLLLTILEFQPLPEVLVTGREIIPAWLMNNNIKIDSLLEISQFVYKIVGTSDAPISFFDLKIQLKKTKKQIESQYVTWAIKILPGIEMVDNGNSYQIKFEYLVSLASKAYRILYETGTPMHLKNIQRQINHRLAKNGFPTIEVGNLGNPLASDSRFKPIGRSGLWSLAEWEDINRNTIVELMLEFFHNKNASATSKEIYEHVLSKRKDVSEHSITLYLGINDKFIRVSKTEYELSAWGNQAYKPATQMSSTEISNLFLPALKAIFADKPDKSIPLSKLIHELSAQTGIAEPTLYMKVYQSPMIRLEDDPTSNAQQKRRKIAYFLNDKQETPSSATSTKLTIREIVQQKIFQYLQKQPNRKSSVSDLFVHIEKVTGKKGPFYGYLSEMVKAGDIRKETENKKPYCYLESPEVDETPLVLSFPEIKDVKDIILKENLVRAIKNFNIDHIDMGLFQLGKLFETELKSFLTEAQIKNKYPITNKDLDALVSMINCVEKNKIIPSSETGNLTFLRQHRNERAHGKVPDLEERKKLMRQAPFLGDLYIKYIIFFNEQRKNL